MIWYPICFNLLFPFHHTCVYHALWIQCKYNDLFRTTNLLGSIWSYFLRKFYLGGAEAGRRGRRWGVSRQGCVLRFPRNCRLPLTKRAARSRMWRRRPRFFRSCDPGKAKLILFALVNRFRLFCQVHLVAFLVVELILKERIVLGRDQLEGAMVLPAPFGLQREEWKSFVDVSRHVRVDIKFKTLYL